MNEIRNKERNTKEKHTGGWTGEKKEEEMMSGSRSLEPPYLVITVNPR
jgi:hypothetical protein